MIKKIHCILLLVAYIHFCRQCIKSNWWQKCPIVNCPGQTSCEKLFNMDHALTNQLIFKSCKEMDSEAELNNDVNTDDVAESRHCDQSLTSGWVRHVIFNIACHINTNSCYPCKYCKSRELLLQKLCAPDYCTHTFFEGIYPRRPESWSIHRSFVYYAQSNDEFAMCDNCSIDTIFSRANVL